MKILLVKPEQKPTAAGQRRHLSARPSSSAAQDPVRSHLAAIPARPAS